MLLARRRPNLRAAELRLRQLLASIKVIATRYYPGLSRSVGSIIPSLADVLTHPV